VIEVFLKNFSKYIGNDFCFLANQLGDDAAQQKYIEAWRQKYSPVFKKYDERKVIEWDIRVARALKGVFTSAAFYVEGEEAKKSLSWTSYYFLSYYSLFHAMLSAIYLLPDENIDSLVNITHSKIRNLFFSVFCNNNNNIISKDAGELYDILKFAREYYSYQMPFNEFMCDSETISNLIEKLPYYLRCCYQLACLHSELIENAFAKHGKLVRNCSEHYEFIYETFLKVNSSKNPITGDYMVEPSDTFRIQDMLKGCAPSAFTIVLEHYCDEFRTYRSVSSHKIPNEAKDYADEVTMKVWKFIYSAIG
jgi:hypothetical protein